MGKCIETHRNASKFFLMIFPNFVLSVPVETFRYASKRIKMHRNVSQKKNFLRYNKEMLNPPPLEYTKGTFLAKVRTRFEVCGTIDETDGTALVLKCYGCGQQLPYDWLKKPFHQDWTGDFGKRLKQNLNTNRSHRKCRLKIEQRNETVLIQKQPSNVLSQPSSAPVINNIQNILIVNLPAVTRTGSSGDPLMCSDIPLPDGKTVKTLLDNPETAVSQFVYKRFLTSQTPSITAPDPSNTKLKVVHRDKTGNHWVDVPLDSTIDDLVYTTLDSLDDKFDAMKHSEFKDWKTREGLTATVGFDKTEAYQKMQNDVACVLKQHGVPYNGK